ncbi:MAG TPA: phage head-tail connector protein [Ruminiclostridium sp.]
MLELMKLLLGIDNFDTKLDGLLNHFINKSYVIISSYCNVDTLFVQHDDVVAQYAAYLYKNRDSEGLLKKTEGEKSVIYEGAIPYSIRLQLPLPRIKVVG